MFGRRMLLVCAAAFLAAGLVGTVARARQSPANDARSALPTAAQLRGFSSIRVTSGNSDSMLRAIRNSDGMSIRVRVAVVADDNAAKRAARMGTMAQAGPMPAGSLTGRKIGQEAWHSAYPSGGLPRGAYTLVTRVGRALVVVDLMHRITEMRHGAPVETVFSAVDLRWAEDVAIGCVNRLTKMGYARTAPGQPVVRSATNVHRR